jgi:hypothetical protein
MSIVLPTPVSTSNMDPSFEGRVTDLQTQAQAAAQARQSGRQVSWFRPGNWNGNPNDVEGRSKPFDRSQANTEGVSAISDPLAPGVVGDVIIAATMIDTLACMERAFRVRQTFRRPRCVAQMTGRQQGHGNAQGPLIQCYVEYLRNLLKDAKSSGWSGVA